MKGKENIGSCQVVFEELSTTTGITSASTQVSLAFFLAGKKLNFVLKSVQSKQEDIFLQ